MNTEQGERNLKLHDSYFDRKLKCGDILDYSAEFFRRNLKKLVAMTLFFHVPVMFVIYFCMNMSSMGSELLGDYIVNGSVMMAIVPLLMFYAGAMLMSVYNLTFYNALSAAVVKFTYESVVNNNTMRPGKAILFGLKKFGWLVCICCLQRSY